MMPFNKFPSIESFGHVWRNNHAMIGGPIIKYGSKIKLHGTNAAIRCEGGEVFAQKRTSDITPEDDNAGFAKWLESRKHVWAMPSKYITEVVTYFGEWAGPGVQKGDAVSRLKSKYFFIFAMTVDDEVLTCPELIAELLPKDCPEMDDVMVLPWSDEDVVLNFSDTVEADNLADQMSDKAESAGLQDPFIYRNFGVEGPGEGYVWMPMSSKMNPIISRQKFSNFTFKVKAERHGAKKAKAASRKVSIPEGAEEFISMFVTEARCEQALQESCDGIAEKPRTADFLKWIGADIKKESEVELAEASLEWKQVAKLVNSAAVQWFHERCDRPVGKVA